MNSRRFPAHIIAILILLLAAAFACDLGGNVNMPVARPTLVNPAGAVPTEKLQPTKISRRTAKPVLVSDWCTVYFTNPNGPESETLRGGPDAKVAQAIHNARVSVDAALYDLDLWSMRDALLEAHKRGVQVRVVTESDYLGEAEMQALIAGGIEVRDDRGEGLMHNKFLVIDRQEVWTGSMNFTVNDAYKNNNNLLHIRSSKLAEDYTAEFEEMFEEGDFGKLSSGKTPYPSFSINGTQVEVFFSPDDGPSARITALLNDAQHSIYFLAFSFTSDEIAEAMIERAGAGVEVQGVMERRQYETNAGTEYDRFLAAGVDVHLDGNPRTMHHKVIVIDGEIVITGSYNFTFNAENRNDENLLILYSPDLAAQFLQEFQRVLEEAAP